MARRHVDIVFIGSDAETYTVIQRFVGESNALHSDVQWIRDPEHLIDSEPPTRPTVWVTDTTLESLKLAKVLTWLDQHKRSQAGIVLVPDGSREHVSRVKAMGGANLLRADRMTAGAFEQLVIHASSGR